MKHDMSYLDYRQLREAKTCPMSDEQYKHMQKGRPGSGFFGHRGRPGERGGSAHSEETEAAVDAPGSENVEQELKQQAEVLSIKVREVGGKVILDNPRDGHGPRTFDSHNEALRWLNRELGKQSSRADRREGRQR
jgi:hypothetical protein